MPQTTPKTSSSSEARGTVKLTRDMAMTLVNSFDASEREGVVTLEINDIGLWLSLPRGQGKLFVGQADMPQEKVHVPL
jgi:hypothetical protein